MIKQHGRKIQQNWCFIKKKVKNKKVGKSDLKT